MAHLVSSLVLALALEGAGAGTLDVPFLPQTPALCGGAAAAMVFRYWGDRHADVQQFAPLVDARAGGIADDVLIAAVRQRGWQAIPLAGSLDLLRERLTAGQPLIILLEDGPARYHYVVVVGIGEEGVLLHDPTWGPAREYGFDRLLRLWRPSNFWTLVITPAAPGLKGRTYEKGDGPPDGALPGTATAGPPRSDCDHRIDRALDEIARRGFETADAILTQVMQACPDAARPVAEMAGVRFAQKRWDEAVVLAERAVARDATNRYAWDVLGSARFLRNDHAGALRAWNRIDKPLLDSVVITGLSRTRYALVAQALGVTPNTILTHSAYRLAERRVHELPSQSGARVSLRPEEDGFAQLHVAIVEPSFPPRGTAAWLSLGADAMVHRRVRAAIPGWTGQGEMWTASWRFWNNRPRAAAAFGAPRVLGLAGVARVETSWEAQTYSFEGATVREERLHGGFVLTDWATPNLRYEVEVGGDSWRPRAETIAGTPLHPRRTVSVGGLVEGRLFDDRVAMTAGAHQYVATSRGAGFRTAALTAAYRSSREARGWVLLADGGVDVASDEAPLAVWTGAGGGQAREPLLRAHPLLANGVIAGTVFGPRLIHATVETQRWLARPSLVPWGIAGFVDLAAASRGFEGATPLFTDVGTGLRLRVPGSESVFRADYAWSLRGRGGAFSVGVGVASGSPRSLRRP